MDTTAINVPVSTAGKVKPILKSDPHHQGAVAATSETSQVSATAENACATTDGQKKQESHPSTPEGKRNI